MFHACLVSTLLCFVYTLRYFYMFSGTNLLARCHSASCLFSSVFWFQKRQKINILGIGWDKSQSQYFTVGNTEPEYETEGIHQGATPLAAWPGLACAWGCGHPGCPLPRLFAYKKP